jgi:hypothetical protein
MGWHYAARKQVDGDGEHWGVVEVYGPSLHTEDNMTPYGESRDELVNELKRMIVDLLQFPDVEDV